MQGEVATDAFARGQDYLATVRRSTRRLPLSPAKFVEPPNIMRSTGVQTVAVRVEVHPVPGDPVESSMLASFANITKAGTVHLCL